MDIYMYLKKDHQKVTTLFNEIENSDSISNKESLFSQLKEELLLHAESEHATFYKALKSYPETKDIVQHADKEHAEVKASLDKISSCPSNDEEWLVLLDELKDSVEHHIKEEEGEMFNKARSLLDEKTEKKLVDDIEELKKKLKTHKA
ncbi:MAG: hypothetical protein BGO77_05095 [Caedibacter sp. 37-49]|nr:MAG: hypothetical protein BGO77_05095 [Caedibacter sp. 37-49]